MGLDLSGRWAAAPATDALRREFVRPELDDSTWATVAVPGHWRDEEAFASSDGPLLYRRRFESEPLLPGERAWLVMEGAFYETDVWLDGSYLGDTEGYFFPHLFEVTAALRQRREHVLAVEVACPQGRAARRAMLGAWARPALLGPSYNPGGLWAPVRLTKSGPVHLGAFTAACTEARPERALVALAARLDSSGPMEVEVVTAFRAPGTEAVVSTRRLHLAAGANRARWRAEVPHPLLWWPFGAGGQALYEVTATVLVDGLVSDSRSLLTGLRQVRMKQMTWEVNGEKVFLQGADLLPGRERAEEVAGHVRAARDAGLNFLRVRAHVGRPELYRAADETGLLIWQELPFAGRRALRSRAVRQAQEAAWLLGHHPSIIAWSAGDLSLAVRRAFDHADGSRPAFGRPPSVGARLLGTGRPVTPRDAGAARTEGTGAPRLDRLERASAIWPAAARLVAGVSAPADLEGLRLLVEGLRRLRFYPVSGFSISGLDSLEGPAAASLRADERGPGGARACLSAACAPLLPVASGLARCYRAGERISFRLYVLNALRQGLGELELRVRLTWPGGGQAWRFAGAVRAASTSFVGRRAAALPSEESLAAAGTPPWQLRLELVLRAGDRTLAHNAYERPLSARERAVA